MRDTLDQTKRVFNLTERPVVIAIKAEIEGVFAPNKPLKPKVTFVNKGRTAAQHFNVTTEIAAKKGTIWMWGFGKTNAQPSGDVFLPAGSDPALIIGPPANAVTLDNAFYEDICNGREQFFIHGQGSYQDLAGEEYLIEYSFKFDPAYGFVYHPMQKWTQYDGEGEDPK